VAVAALAALTVIDLTTEDAAPHGIARLAIDTNPPGSRPAEPGKVTKKQP